MDPDATLADILHSVREYHLGNRDIDLGDLIELIDALDQWLYKGGFLPQRWTKNKIERIGS